MSVLAPHGYAAILALGDPHRFIGRDGGIDEVAWQQHLGLVVVDFPKPLPLSFGPLGGTAHAIRCHPISADAWRHAFASIDSEGLWSELHTFGGGYTFRTQRGAEDRISTHAWGLAGDFDVANNKLGEKPRMNPSLVQIFEYCGFTWGGRFARIDGMHLQFCSGY